MGCFPARLAPTSQNTNIKPALSRDLSILCVAQRRNLIVNWIIDANPCPGLFYGTRAQDGFILRIRTPGGTA